MGSGAATSDQGTRPRPSPVFVGRGRELHELKASLEQSIGGRGSLVLVVGEPGIGKSRLAEEVTAVARSLGAGMAVGRCWEGGGAPVYWPWIQVLRSCREPAELLARLAGQEGPAPGHPGSVDADRARFRLFDDVTRFLVRGAEAVPLVVVLDDLHAADPSSLLLLRFLATGLSQSRLLVIGTYRELESRSTETFEILGDLCRVATRIPLRGLSRTDVMEYIERVADVRPSDAAVSSVYAATEGNPFFLREVVRLLVAEGRLGYENTGGDEPVLRVPEEVRVVIRRRLATLSNEARTTLRVAAVAGRDFDLALLEHAGNLSVHRLLEVVREAISAGVVLADQDVKGRFSFSHGLIRETLYEGMPDALRLQLHQRIAETLAQLHGADIEPHLAAIAHHFAAAAPLGVADRAVLFATRAGERAVTQFAYEQAAEHFGQAIESLARVPDGDERRRGELLLARGDALWRADDPQNAAAAFEEAARVARLVDDADMLARAAFGCTAGFGLFLNVVRSEEARIVLLEEALSALGHRDSLLRVQVLALLAAELLYKASLEQRERLSQEALDSARRLDDPAAILVALYGRHFAAWTPDSLEERFATATEMIELAGRVGDTDALLLGHEVRLACLLEAGDAAAIHEQLDLILRTIRPFGGGFYRWRATTLRATRAILTGRLQEAEALVDESSALGRGHREAAEIVRNAQLFAIRWAQGRAAELDDHVRRFSEEYPFIPRWRNALLAAEKGPGAAREELDRQAAAGFATLPRNSIWLLHVVALGYACVTAGDAERAREIYGLLLPYADRNAVSMTEQVFGPVSLTLGMLATVMGRWTEAERFFVDAEQRCGALGARTIGARVLVEHARMLLSRDGAGASPSARTLLERAERVSVEVGMPGVAERARALVEDGGAGEPATANVFRREGEFWTVTWNGDVFRLKDGKGLRYLAVLLRHPDQDIPAAQVAADGGNGSGRPPDEVGRRDGVTEEPRHDVLDTRAKQAYRARMSDIQAELDEARAWNDGERVARLELERDALGQELRAALGLNGRSRSLPSPAERARINVTKAVRAAIERVGESSPSLAVHLSESVHTGRHCAYRPRPAVRWRF